MAKDPNAGTLKWTNFKLMGASVYKRHTGSEFLGAAEVSAKKRQEKSEEAEEEK
jgi:hypothetical protein